MQAGKFFEKNIDNRGRPILLNVASVKKVHPSAVMPVERGVGFDVTLIGRSENRTEDRYQEINEFETGLVLTPPQGYHFKLQLPSGLSDAGYHLVPGEEELLELDDSPLVVKLIKFKNTQDLDLPLEGVRLMIVESNHFPLAQIGTPVSKNRDNEKPRPSYRGASAASSTLNNAFF